jgi:two-component system, chemotaxis family, chemotaxis protein CheY
MNLPAKHILLVDDSDIENFLSREIITMFMPLAKIDSFNKAEEALGYIHEQLKLHQPLPDIILLDINMPLMDGWMGIS